MTAASSIAGPPEPAPTNRDVSVSLERLGLSALPAENRWLATAPQSVPSKKRCALTSAPPCFMFPKRLLTSFSSSLPIRFEASFGTVAGNATCGNQKHETINQCEFLNAVRGGEKNQRALDAG